MRFLKTTFFNPCFNQKIQQPRKNSTLIHKKTNLHNLLDAPRIEELLTIRRKLIDLLGRCRLGIPEVEDAKERLKKLRVESKEWAGGRHDW